MRRLRLVAQKLAYFAQTAGENSSNLNFLLQKFEGHYISGYGDRGGRSDIELLSETEREIEPDVERYRIFRHGPGGRTLPAGCYGRLVGCPPRTPGF